MNEQLIEKYAELIVKVGANVQKGQYVIIRTGVFEEEFASIVARKCYEAGAKRVFVKWQSSVIDSIDYRYGSEDDLKHVFAFEEAEAKF